MRIGFGYDIHRLMAGRRLVIGGVIIPHEVGEAGHSDGDVLSHALIDALLGAAGLPDIGEQFPPSDSRYKDIASTELLSRVLKLLKQHDLTIINIDTCVILEEPKLFTYKKRIGETLAKILGLLPSQISIKAKTKEGLGSTGRNEAIEAYAIALLDKNTGL